MIQTGDIVRSTETGDVGLVTYVGTLGVPAVDVLRVHDSKPLTIKLSAVRK